MSSSGATRSEVAALSGDDDLDDDEGAGAAGGVAGRCAEEGSARARFCKRRRCTALTCCAERSSSLIQGEAQG